MAVLLMAAARRGSMHNAIAKMLCLHIPSLHPPTFTELELEVPAVVQIAALMGVGLLYQDSAHRSRAGSTNQRRCPPPQPLSLSPSHSLTLTLPFPLLPSSPLPLTLSPSPSPPHPLPFPIALLPYLGDA